VRYSKAPTTILTKVREVEHTSHSRDIFFFCCGSGSLILLSSRGVGVFFNFLSVAEEIIRRLLLDDGLDIFSQIDLQGRSLHYYDDVII
jgi:hypothetical protein